MGTYFPAAIRLFVIDQNKTSYLDFNNITIKYNYTYLANIYIIIPKLNY